MLHNEVRDLLAALSLDAGYKDIAIEPTLQPVQGEQFKHKTAKREDDAHPDVRVRGFWKNWRNAFFDVTAFSPYAPSYQGKSLKSLYRQAERRKTLAYSERILQLEHGDFTPMVFSVSGGMGQQASCALKRIGHRIAERADVPFSVVMGRIRVRFSFALLRSTLVMLRGSRPYRPQAGEAIDLAVSQCKADLVGFV